MNATGPGATSSELRLALAMRGGLSLAVWMGGACCETAALRRAAPLPADGEPEPGDSVYRALLGACGYDDVDIDVVVGTSAGGLNGVLLACHLVYGMPFDAGVRDVWLRLGDLEGLLRRSTPFRVPDSLLRGDEVVFTQLRRSLDDLLATPQQTAPRLARLLRLILTATRLRPRRDWVRPTRGAPLLVGRSNAFFRFRHRAPTTDFPGDPHAEWRALNRLAFAARTSSSFPGAFEPGRIFVGGDAPAWDEPPRVDMRGVSSETGHPDENSGGCVELVDGGPLDNIPVAWAVRAIAGTPVTRKVDRWLLFLQPVPPFPPAPAAGGRRRVTRAVRLAVKSLAVKTGSESPGPAGAAGRPDGGGEFGAPHPAAARRRRRHRSPLPAQVAHGLARTVRLLMDWIRAYEAVAEPVDAAGLEERRGLLYTYRYAIATLIAARDRLLLRAYGEALAGGEAPADAIAPLAVANGRLTALMPAVPTEWQEPGAWQAWSGALAAARTDPARWWRGVLAALVAGGAAALVQFGRDGPGGWWAALMVYAVLFVVTAVHPWLYPRPDTEPPG
ncbi:patatin-like phospholipase family protein [Streptomyces sp. IBSNAI002]|uniref:patatin-like phospholipase family protein n=1 Tax=Streptomyces sp. IBSNAI002 TaxID=3457500 RepID=UPI003FD68998